MTDEPARTILNVDDDEATLYTTSKILRQAGFEVVEARTGAEALELAGQLPDAIVLDIKLPDIDGYEVCRRLRADAETSWIPVLHVSAVYRAIQAKITAMESGSDGFMLQPLHPELLIAYVERLLKTGAERRVAMNADNENS
ncbi:MAG: response regulator transcription factor [Phycisphaerae bacterium]|jgi:DNA-binding response OmpR family regulator|nr:response regulator transcription factor [Phycisphaerae bacterium]